MSLMMSVVVWTQTKEI